jgi:nucleoside 2-deoxyribosyltransferase
MRLYVTATFKGIENRAEIEALCALVEAAGWESFCFVRDVEHWEHVFDDPAELMQRSLREVMRCDALLLDMNAKPTGRAIEAGMAYATGRRVIVILPRGLPIKATVRGIADAVIEYDALADIAAPLARLRQEWT